MYARDFFSKTLSGGAQLKHGTNGHELDIHGLSYTRGLSVYIFIPVLNGEGEVMLFKMILCTWSSLRCRWEVLVSSTPRLRQDSI